MPHTGDYSKMKKKESHGMPMAADVDMNEMHRKMGTTHQSMPSQNPTHKGNAHKGRMGKESSTGY